jgi:hypothetical protein
VQRIYFHADGTPDFGIPVGNGQVPDRFSPADRPSEFISLEGSRLVIGAGSLPATQIRLIPGLAGAATVSLEPIMAPGKFVRRTAQGEIVLAANDQSAAFAEQSSFASVPGLADSRAVTFGALGAPGSYLRHRNNTLEVSQARSAAELASATFYVN